MSDLLDLQRRFADAVMQPLTRAHGMRRTLRGRRTDTVVQSFIKPNQTLTSFERLEIYNRQYWLRLLSSFAEDFPGLRAVVGASRFEGLMRAYLDECPSRSFTLRNLGSDLEAWLLRNPYWVEPRRDLALDVVRLEWAHIEAFDAGSTRKLEAADVQNAGLDLRVSLQPYLRLLALNHPVDDLLIAVRNHRQKSRPGVRQHQWPRPEQVYLAVHRLEDSVYYKRLTWEAFQLLGALRDGHSLAQALELAFESILVNETEHLASIQQGFANWTELGWFSPRQ